MNLNQIFNPLTIFTDLTFLGNAARTLWVGRHPTANTAGNALTVQSGGATSGATDKDAGQLTLEPGLSTGTGKSSVRTKRLTRAASTGTSDNSLLDAYVVPSEKRITAEGSVDLFEVSLPAGGMAGGRISYTITATDGTELQVHTGIAHYAAVNKAAVYTTSIVDSDTPTVDADAGSSGVTTDTWAITSGTDKITISVTVACSVITANDIRIFYTVLNGSEQTITQL